MFGNMNFTKSSARMKMIFGFADSACSGMKKERTTSPTNIATTSAIKMVMIVFLVLIVLFSIFAPSAEAIASDVQHADWLDVV